MRPVLAVTCFLLWISAAQSMLAERMPRIAGQTLTDRSIEFPTATAGSAAILLVGFSHASQGELKTWADRAEEEFRNNTRVVIYSIAVLEDAPRFVRGMAVHGMKSGTPVARRDHFVVVYQGEPELKKAAKFEAPDEAYVLLLDPSGNIKRVGHGRETDGALKELSKEARAALP